ncbi:MAG TPA: hypothetical protein VFX45_08790 [Solirubrobacterales bacterium]|nr:hypothetical protein [Solirubrobacterales bacterium]
MRKRDIDRALAGAYPLDRAAIAKLPLEGAEEELVGQIVAEPEEAPVLDAASATPSHLARSPRWRTRFAGLAAGCAIATAAFLGLTGSGHGPAGSAEPAYAAELLRLANISPPILFDEPEWIVATTNVRAVKEGWTSFQVGTQRHPAAQEQATFRWNGKSVSARARELAAHGGREVGTAPVLATEATVYEYPHPGKRVFELVALWDEGGRAFEFRTSVPRIATFEQRLLALKRVDRDQWLKVVARDLESFPQKVTYINPDGSRYTYTCVNGHPLHPVPESVVPKGVEPCISLMPEPQDRDRESAPEASI